MKRSMMQVYVKNSDQAVPIYQNAFGASLLCDHRSVKVAFRGPTDWSPLAAGIIDRFGVNWCIFV